MINVTRSPFNYEDVVSNISEPDAGCIVTFRGIVRGKSKGKAVERMSIEVYPDMAISELTKIRDEAKALFKIIDISIVHRYGDLAVGEDIVIIAVSASHRAEAFEACKYVIDKLKKRVPIWKKEYTPEGDYWVEGDRPE